jgi:hypothetical protein
MTNLCMTNLCMTNLASSLLPLLSAGAALTFLGACAAPPGIEQAPGDPPLVLESFFDGTSEGEGKFVNTWTGSERRFKVHIVGTWDGRTLTLVEDFDFADGEKDRKTWTLMRTAPGSYAGTREDVVGEARAWTEGKVVKLAYDIKLGGWTVAFSDVLALRADGSLLNRATVGKWGIRLGRVELTLRKSGV